MLSGQQDIAGQLHLAMVLCQFCVAMQQNVTLGVILRMTMQVQGMAKRLVAPHMGNVFPDLRLQRLDRLAYLGHRAPGTKFTVTIPRAGTAAQDAAKPIGSHTDTVRQNGVRRIGVG